MKEKIEIGKKLFMDILDYLISEENKETRMLVLNNDLLENLIKMYGEDDFQVEKARNVIAIGKEHREIIRGLYKRLLSQEEE